MLSKYFYDVDGERWMRADYDPAANTAKKTTYFLRSGGRVINELHYDLNDPAYNKSKTYFYGGGRMLSTILTEPQTSGVNCKSPSPNYVSNLSQNGITGPARLIDETATETKKNKFNLSYNLVDLGSDVLQAKIELYRLIEEDEEDYDPENPWKLEDTIIFDPPYQSTIPILFEELKKGKTYSVNLSVYSNMVIDPYLGSQWVTIQTIELLWPKDQDLRASTDLHYDGLEGKIKLSVKWDGGQMNGGYNFKVKHSDGSENPIMGPMQTKELEFDEDDLEGWPTETVNSLTTESLSPSGQLLNSVTINAVSPCRTCISLCGSTPPPPLTTINYFFSDHLGTPRVVTNQGGNIIAQFDYEPYGVSLPSNPLCDPNQKFALMDRDCRYDASGGYMEDNAWFRNYSNNQGRFLRPDPLYGSMTNPQGWNRYSYTFNNPINYADPTGLYRSGPPRSQGNLSGTTVLPTNSIWSFNKRPVERQSTTYVYATSSPETCDEPTPTIEYDEERGVWVQTYDFGSSSIFSVPVTNTWTDWEYDPSASSIDSVHNNTYISRGPEQASNPMARLPGLYEWQPDRMHWDTFFEFNAKHPVVTISVIAIGTFAFGYWGFIGATIGMEGIYGLLSWYSDTFPPSYVREMEGLNERPDPKGIGSLKTITPTYIP